MDKIRNYSTSYGTAQVGWLVERNTRGLTEVVWTCRPTEKR